MVKQHRLRKAFVRGSKIVAAYSAIVGLLTVGSAPLLAEASRRPVAAAQSPLVSLKWTEQEPDVAMAAKLSAKLSATISGNEDVRKIATSHAEILDRMESDRPLFEAFAAKNRLGSALLKKLLADFDALEASRVASHEERALRLEAIGGSFAARTSSSGVETVFRVNGRPRLSVFESPASHSLPRVESPDGATGPRSTEPAWKDEVDDAIQQYYDLVGYLTVVESDSNAVAADLANGIANGEFTSSEPCESASGPSDHVDQCLDFAIHALGEAIGFSAAASGAVAAATSAYTNFVAFMGSAELAAMSATAAAEAVSAATWGFVATLSVGWIAAAALVGAAVYVAYEAYQCRHNTEALRYSQVR